MNVDEIVSELSKATEAELAEALSTIRTEVEGVGPEPTQENVDQLEKLAAAKFAVEGEVTRRQELATRAGNARAAFAVEPAPEPTPEPEPTPVPAPEPEPEPEGDKGAVQASAKLGKIGKKTAAAPVVGQVAGRTVSVGGTGEFAAGAELTRESLAEEFVTRFSQLSGTGVTGRHTVARMNFSYPAERQLNSDDPVSVNRAKIEAVTTPDALVAAGGFCAPLENLYDIDVAGVTNRPVRDSALTRFGVTRGGIQYRPAMDALADGNGIGIWTATNDAAVTDPPGASPVKTCRVIDCPGLQTAVVDALYLCLQFPNFTARFDPEWVDASTRAALVAHARFAENNLLTKVLGGSKLLTQAKTVSATRDILVALDKTVAYYRNRHRLDSMVPLRFVLPRWVLDLIRADLTRGMGSVFNSEQLGLADAAINTFFRNRGVNVTWHLDGRGFDDPTDNPDVVDADDIPQQFYDNATAFTPIPGFINKIDSALYAEGDWLFLDGGTLDLGLVRDSTLNKTNRYQTFTESWEGVAFRGIESLRLVLEVQPTGMAGGTLDLSALVD